MTDRSTSNGVDPTHSHSAYSCRSTFKKFAQTVNYYFEKNQCANALGFIRNCINVRFRDYIRNNYSLSKAKIDLQDGIDDYATYTTPPNSANTSEPEQKRILHLKIIDALRALYFMIKLYSQSGDCKHMRVRFILEGDLPTTPVGTAETDKDIIYAVFNTLNRSATADSNDKFSLYFQNIFQTEKTVMYTKKAYITPENDPFRETSIPPKLYDPAKFTTGTSAATTPSVYECGALILGIKLESNSSSSAAAEAVATAETVATPTRPEGGGGSAPQKKIVRSTESTLNATLNRLAKESKQTGQKIKQEQAVLKESEKQEIVRILKDETRQMNLMLEKEKKHMRDKFNLFIIPNQIILNETGTEIARGITVQSSKESKTVGCAMFIEQNKITTLLQKTSVTDTWKFLDIQELAETGSVSETNLSSFTKKIATHGTDTHNRGLTELFHRKLLCPHTLFDNIDKNTSIPLISAFRFSEGHTIDIDKSMGINIDPSCKLITMEKYPNVALINSNRGLLGLVRNPSETNSWIIDTDKQSKDLYDTFNQYIEHLIRCGKTELDIMYIICNGRESPEEVDTSSSAASAAGSGKVASAASAASAAGIEGSSKVAPTPPTKKPEGGGGSLGGARKTRRRRSTRSRGSRRYRRRS